MKENNLCLECKLAVFIRGKADLGKLPRGKRKEVHEQMDKVKLDHGVNLWDKVFPFIWCPKWKKEMLYPFENKTLGCKFFAELDEIT